MPDYSPEALTAAAVAIHDVDCPDRHCSGSALGHCYRLADAALKAAAPLLTADLERAVERAEVLVAERDRQWAEALRENERLLRKLTALEAMADG